MDHFCFENNLKNLKILYEVKTLFFDDANVARPICCSNIFDYNTKDRFATSLIGHTISGMLVVHP